MENEIIQMLEKMADNYHRHTIFISSQNMKELPRIINDYQLVPDIFITPYLINKNDKSIYELLGYEYSVQVIDHKKEKMKFNKKNALPKEVLDNITPGIRVDKQEYLYARDMIEHYLVAMDNMEFLEIKNVIPILSEAELYYQIF